jgi:hypothetical protein
VVTDQETIYMTVFCFQQSGYAQLSYPPLTCNHALNGCRFYTSGTCRELTSIAQQVAAREAARDAGCVKFGRLRTMFLWL